MRVNRRSLLIATGASALAPAAVQAADRAEIDARVDRSLKLLFTIRPETKELFANAKGVLVMPNITKAGVFVGGSYGEGALMIGEAKVAYYSVTAASIGIQVGAQIFRQALFFMTEDALRSFRTSSGWSLGGEVEAAGDGRGVTYESGTNTFNRPIVSYTWGQDGAMIGATIEGAKYTRISR
ncbi:MAG: lipid-binding SYLF domain-containing protein [Pseudomonadota bacterium]